MIEPGIDPQSGDALNPSLPRSRLQTWLDGRVHGIGAINDAQDGHLRCGIGLAQQLHCQGRLGPERFPGRRWRLPTGPAGSVGSIRPWAARQQISQNHPSGGAHRFGSIRTAGTGRVKRTGPPDLLAGAVPFGIIKRHGVIASPAGRLLVLEHVEQLAFHGLAVPRPILGKMLQEAPPGLQTERGQQLGDRVFFPT
ncbi:MAG TPA: hypothetical protein VNP04_05045 [Alphaproteobacteria bacterium]|nr:hypothetical protein [Alphaproteobacteria bacterium]